MERLQEGFAVFAVEDRRLGEVERINACCFEVAPRGSNGRRLNLLPEAIFHVDRRRVTLVCVYEEVSRYVCPLHAQPAARG